MYRKIILLLTYICIFLCVLSGVVSADDNYASIISDAADFLTGHGVTIPEPYCIVYSTPDTSIKYSVCFSDTPFYFNENNRLTSDGNASRADYSTSKNCFSAVGTGVTSYLTVSKINLMYVNHDVMNYDRSEIIFPVTGDSVELPGGSENIESGDIGDYSYNNDTVESEKGGVITKILDPIFIFVNWLFGWLPDLSTDVDSNWLAELVRLVRSALWFFPKDVAIGCFVTIQFWMTTHLFVAVFYFILKFIPFIG